MKGTEIDRDEEIRRLAYKFWQEAGCPDGYEVQHWLKAETIWLEGHRPKDKPEVSASPKRRRRRQTRIFDRDL
jgi:hypothetical protein